MANIKKYIAKILAKKSASRGKTKAWELFGCGCCRSAARVGDRECVPTRVSC